MEELINYFRSLFEPKTRGSLSSALEIVWKEFPLRKIFLMKLILSRKELVAILAASGLSMSLLVSPSKQKLIQIYEAFKRMGDFKEETGGPMEAVANEGWGYTGFESINVGTLATIIAAAMGIPSIKSSSKKFFSYSGSGDQLESLRVPRIDNIDIAKQVIQQTGLAFLKGEEFSKVSTIFTSILISKLREEKELLAWLTYPLRFAFLLINPLQATFGVRGLGVDLLEVFNKALITIHPEIRRNIAVIGLNKDGTIIDEATIAGTTKIHVIDNERERLLIIGPNELRDLGLNSWNPKDIIITNSEQGYRIAEELLKGDLPKNSPFVHLVAFNAALHCLACHASPDFSNLRDCIETALAVILDGYGWRKLKEYRVAVEEARKLDRH